MDKEFTVLEFPDLPVMSDIDIEESIDNVLSSEECLKELNELILDDEKERYVRALLNRISKAITILEDGIKFCENDSQGIYDKCNIAINREKKVIDIYARVVEEFKIATDEEYELLKKQIFS